MAKHIHLNAECTGILRKALLCLALGTTALVTTVAHADDVHVDGVLEQIIEVDGNLSVSQNWSIGAMDVRNLTAAAGDIRVGSGGVLRQVIASRAMTVEQHHSAGAISIGNGVIAGMPGFGK